MAARSDLSLPSDRARLEAVHPRSGLMTPNAPVDDPNLLRRSRDAEALPQVERAWLFHHLKPIGVDLDGHVMEGRTLLSAHVAGLVSRTP
jgi:hypothetical protein